MSDQFMRSALDTPTATQKALRFAIDKADWGDREVRYMSWQTISPAVRTADERVATRARGMLELLFSRSEFEAPP